MKSMPGNAKVKLLLFLFALIGLAILTIPFFLVPPGNLVIRLTDEIFNTDLSAKKAHLKFVSPEHEMIASIQKNTERYSATFNRIKSGQTQLEIRVKGYKPHTASVNILPMKSVIADVSLIPIFGRVKVFALNAKNKRKLSNFTASVSSANSSAFGNEQGAILSELEPGVYQIETSASGFCPNTKKISVKEGETAEVKIAMSPKLSSDELARVILNWGKNPSDLDSHLFLPKSGSLKSRKSRHVYYSNKISDFKNGRRAAELDVDDTDSYGPETITISKGLKGTYQYAIYLYAGHGTLGRSGATVELVTNGCENKKFSVPTECNKKWWHVFNLKYDGSDVRLTRQNACRTQRQMNWRTGVKRKK